MVTIEFKLELPDHLAREAEARGLLTQQAIESWLREEIRRRVGEGSDSIPPGVEFEVPPPTEAELEATLGHLQGAHISRARLDCPPEMTVEAIADPAEIARNRDRHERSRRNADWLQSHWGDVRLDPEGRFLVVAGQEAFVAETWQEAWSKARAAHPDDDGAFAQYVPSRPDSGSR